MATGESPSKTLWDPCERTAKSRSGFDSDSVIDRRPNPLLAAQVAFRRLNGDMPQKELDLLQFSSRGVAESGTGPTKVMRSQFLQSDPFRGILHDVPDGLLRHTFTQSPSHLGDTTEDLASVDSRCIQPDSQLFHDPAWDRNGANMSCLALQIDDGPVFLPLFQMLESQGNGFVPAKTAGKQQRKKRAISLALQVLTVGGLPECKALLGAQPVAETDSEISYAFYTANSRGQVGAQEAGVRRLIGEAPDGAQSKVDGSRRKLACFKVAAIAENNRSVQGKSRLRAVPIDEFVDRVAISALAVDTGQAVQNCCL